MHAQLQLSQMMARALITTAFNSQLMEIEVLQKKKNIKMLAFIKFY